MCTQTPELKLHNVHNVWIQKIKQCNARGESTQHITAGLIKMLLKLVVAVLRWHATWLAVHGTVHQLRAYLGGHLSAYQQAQIKFLPTSTVWLKNLQR